MTIAYDCPQCGRKVQGPDALAGQKARCPFCQAVITVPVPQVLEAEVVAQPTSAPEFEHLQPVPAPIRPAADHRKEESRRPCPMCGEMILLRAVKCRFCGEIFDRTLRRRSGEPGLDSSFREQMYALGGLWLFFACLIVLGGWLISGESPRDLPKDALKTILVIFGIAGFCWFSCGLFTCLKQLWAVYAGLTVSYLSVLGTVISLVHSLSANRGGFELCSGAISLVVVIVGIAQGHRVLGMHARLAGGREDED